MFHGKAETKLESGNYGSLYPNFLLLKFVISVRKYITNVRPRSGSLQKLVIAKVSLYPGLVIAGFDCIFGFIATLNHLGIAKSAKLEDFKKDKFLKK